VAVVGGMMVEAVMRLRKTEAARQAQGGVYMRCFGPGRLRPQKAGNRC